MSEEQASTPQPTQEQPQQPAPQPQQQQPAQPQQPAQAAPQQQAETQQSAGEGQRLIMFTGKECDHCHENLPDVEKVEKELGIQFEKLEVWHDSKNAAFLEKVDQDESGNVFCGGIPLYYNEKTGKKLCGPQPYEKLLALAKGE